MKINYKKFELTTKILEYLINSSVYLLKNFENSIHKLTYYDNSFCLLYNSTCKNDQLK